MMRRIPVALGVATLAFVLIAQAADRPQAKIEDKQPSSSLQEEARYRQERLAQRFKDFEAQLLLVAQRLEASGKQEDKDKAQILRAAIKLASESGVDVRFLQVVDLLKNSKQATSREVQQAIDLSEELSKNIREMLNLLLTDSRDKSRRDEIERIQNLLKELNRIIRDQKIVRAQTERGQGDPKSQNEVTDATKRLSGQETAKAGNGKGNEGKGKGESKGEGKNKGAGKGEGKEDTNKPKGEGKSGEGKSGDNSKSGDNKAGEGKSGEGKSGEGKAGEGKSGEGKSGEGKAGEGKSGEGKSGEGKAGEGKSGEGKAGEGKSGEGKSGEGKAGEGKSGKAGEGKAGEGKAGEPKSGAGKAGEGKSGEGKAGQPGSGQGKGRGEGKGQAKGGQGAGKGGEGKGDAKGGGQGKAGQGQAKGGGKGSQGSQGSQGNQGNQGKQGSKGGQQAQKGPQPPPPPAKKAIDEAIPHQQRAEKGIENKDNPGATDDQNKAIDKLEEARRRLEEILKQLREEEILKTLADLQRRCEYMLAMQKEVYDGTTRLDKAIGENPSKKATRADEQKSQQLADREGLIVKEASFAETLVKSEGSAVAFADGFTQLVEDMRFVQKSLNKTDVAQFTQKTELDIIQLLEWMIDALKKAQQQAKSGQGQGQGQAGKPGNKPLVDLLAELKLIRFRQLMVNKQTEDAGQRYSGEQTDDGNVKERLKQLSDRQDRLKTNLHDIVTGKNK